VNNSYFVNLLFGFKTKNRVTNLILQTQKSMYTICFFIAKLVYTFYISSEIGICLKFGKRRRKVLVQQ